jgi:uncharacterized membrane protein
MLKQQRLDSLSDGIFAIVMTLLVLEIRVPELRAAVSENDLVYALIETLPLVVSYFLSFTLLYVYWRGQHYISSVFAHNLDSRLTSINAIFLLLIGLVPFSTHFLGLYAFSQTAIILYGVHMLLISLALLWMRVHVRDSADIENEPIDKKTDARGMMRIVMPGAMAILAIALSFVNTLLSVALFMVAIYFNLATSNAHWLNNFFDWVSREFLQRPLRKKKGAAVKKKKVVKK